MKVGLIIAFLLVVVGSNAQNNSLLYAIKGKGIKTSYLFGTMHIVPDSVFYFSEKLEKTLAKADELVLEIGDLNDQQKAMKLMNLTTGSCFDIFSSEQKDSVIAWGSQLLKMSAEAFEKGYSSKKPLMLIQIGTQAMVKGPIRMYELELLGRASANQQKISGLETMEYQVGLFDQMTDSSTREMILAMVRKPNDADSSSIQLMQLYQKKDIDGLAKLIAQSDEMAGSVDALLNNRNKNWIPVMIEKMKTTSCFFAVGAGHLGGQEGVISLLRAAGYTVTPISY